MKITIIVGGNNDPSNSDFLANTFAEELKKQGVAVTKYRLKDMPLDHFSLKHYEMNTKMEKDYLTLENAVKESDGVVLANPIWNFSVPADTKNFLDRIGRFALDETHSVGTLKGKPFYLIFTGGAPTAAFPGLIRKTTSHIPQAIKYFGGALIGMHYEERCTKGRGVFGLVVDKRPKTLGKIRSTARRFASIVGRFSKTGRFPQKKRKKFAVW
jgi:multimeric flavodoxin WrbA